MNIKNLRQQIDRIDRSLVRLLNQRVRISLDISRFKRKVGKSAYSPDREIEVLERTSVANKGPLGRRALEGIYREIMSASLALDTPLRIAYFGPEATFTHLAAMKRFGSQVEYISCHSIDDVFLEVERDNADYGVIPVENSIEGAVNHTLDMLVDSELKISTQIILDISHNLLSRCKKEGIKRVYSNPHVFGQCRIWLKENLPHAENIEVSSTTRAAQIASREKSSACIASLLAAKIYALKVIAVHIEDSPHNITRFLVVGRNDVPRSGRDKTSVMFSIKDKVGALYDILVSFKKYRINLTKIESRPSKKKAWDYYFFVDLDGHKDDTRVKKALGEVEHKTKFFKVLGSYPIAD
ncbi:MAG: prephenate dehydratase [Candidatus Omnitrophota bacterium]|jgi:chorismate mutase/prephenate dehydratase|nr:MAG: prephenate dehydratase [Candidatus Omnitrophota bacterium]